MARLGARHRTQKDAQEPEEPKEPQDTITHHWHKDGNPYPQTT